jgi:hypothetical protein
VTNPLAESHAPLIFAGVEYLFPIYRRELKSVPV